MTTTQVQQPEALRIADALKRRAPFLGGSSTIDQAEKKLRRLHAENEALKATVNEAVAVEREACAMVCESLFVPEQVLGAHPDYLEGKHMAKSQCAAAIRARGTS